MDINYCLKIIIHKDTGGCVYMHTRFLQTHLLIGRLVARKEQIPVIKGIFRIDI